jgi:hypothetical protein
MLTCGCRSPRPVGGYLKTVELITAEKVWQIRYGDIMEGLGLVLNSKFC